MRSTTSAFIPRALGAEDQDFHRHHGVDPGGIAGAFLEASGPGGWCGVAAPSPCGWPGCGSIIRAPTGKAVEAFRALQIEAAHKKERILEEWLNQPFGGNLVGIEAASRAWLGKSAGECSLAESALLIGLPNAPERLRPDRHPEAATRRKALILDRMLQCDMITDAEHAEAMGQEIRIRTRTRSDNERHVGWMAIDRSGRGRVVRTTIDAELQSLAEDMVARHSTGLPEELDIAVVLVELECSSIRALVGSSDPGDPRDGRVNGATARRSPGSSLKPFLYALAFEEHRLSYDSIVSDAPLDLDGWRPRNIEQDFLGPMPAGGRSVAPGTPLRCGSPGISGFPP